MAKDSYWFKHDSTSGRGLRIKKIQHIYGHWGKGVYWDVIEVLREQDNYTFESDESSLHMLSELIGLKEFEKFNNWFKDCLKLGLFKIENNRFFSEVLIENMSNWESKKSNGNKGGRPTKTETKTESKPKQKPNQNHKRIVDKIKEDKKITINDVYAYFELSGYRKDVAEKFYNYYDVGGWRDAKGNKVKNWKQKAQAVWFKDENKIGKKKYDPTDPYQFHG